MPVIESGDDDPIEDERCSPPNGPVAVPPQTKRREPKTHIEMKTAVAIAALPLGNTRRSGSPPISVARFLENTLGVISKQIRGNHFERVLDQLDQLDNVDRKEGATALREYASDMLKIADGLWPLDKGITIDGD